MFHPSISLGTKVAICKIIAKYRFQQGVINQRPYNEKKLNIFLPLSYANRNTIAVFQNKEVRKIWHQNQWYFVIVDIVSILTDSAQPSGYIKDMRRRDEELNKGWGQIATPLKIETAGGKQNINCANTEGIFRIIQSIPSPKAEPFKRWLAKVGHERIQEIENPELAQERMNFFF